MAPTATLANARSNIRELDWLLERVSETYRLEEADYRQLSYKFVGRLPAHMARLVRDSVKDIKTETIDTQRGRFGGVWRPYQREQVVNGIGERETIRVAVSWASGSDTITCEVDLFWECGPVEQEQAAQ